MASVFNAILFLSLISHVFGDGVEDNDEPGPDRQLLFVAFDGLGHKYLQSKLAKFPDQLNNFRRLEKMGVTTEGLGNIPAFFSMTYPTFTTALTGLHIENHGIVSNQFYDPEYDENFRFYTHEEDPKWWKDGEHIWVTASKNNKRTGVIFLPASDREVMGYRPDFWLPYNESVPFEYRVDKAMEMLEDGFDFVGLYFEEPDYAIHQYGVSSEEGERKTQMMDGLLGRILDGLESPALNGKVNFILMSDHGMVNIHPRRSISLFNYVDQEDIDVVISSAFAFIRPVDPNKTEIIYEKLRNSHPRLKVYLKADLPEECHCKNNKRISPIVAFAHEAWTINGSNGFSTHSKGLTTATHGYDNTLPSMRSIFFATGPDFGSHVKVEPFSVINYYALMCRLLRIPAAPNNGSDAVVEALLATGNSAPERGVAGVWIFVFLIASIASTA